MTTTTAERTIDLTVVAPVRIRIDLTITAAADAAFAARYAAAKLEAEVTERLRAL